MNSRLAGRRLYIADLTRHQAAMERGKEPMNPIRYRVLAKRLHSALAGQACATLRHGFPELPPRLLATLNEALETRHFDEFGRLDGPAAAAVKTQAESLLTRLRVPAAPSRK